MLIVFATYILHTHLPEFHLGTLWFWVRELYAQF